ncbi:MAG: hypothetical protein AAB503_01735 [Patescibacteria group bacterium]
MQNKAKRHNDENNGSAAFFVKRDASEISARGAVLGLALGMLTSAGNLGVFADMLFVASVLLGGLVTILIAMFTGFSFGTRFGVIAGFLYGTCASAGYALVYFLFNLSKLLQ